MRYVLFRDAFLKEVCNQRMGVVQNVFEGWEKCLMLWKPIYFLDQQEDWEMTSYVVYKHQGGNK